MYGTFKHTALDFRAESDSVRPHTVIELGVVWEDAMSKSTFVFSVKKGFEEMNRITSWMK